MKLRLTYKHLLITLAALLATQAFSEDAVRLTLEDLEIANESIEVIKGEEGLLLRIEAVPKKGGLNPLFELLNPEISGDSYALLGEVSCEGVEEQGYLEMWNHLPLKQGETEIGASFFSRTLGNSGPMKVLSGDEDWRPFLLPARIDDGSGRRPLKLTINAILPEGGVVKIRNLRLRPSLGIASAQKSSLRVAVVSASITALIFGSAIGIFVAKKKKQEKELTRIRNLDAV